jgi:predicted acylesterase/phospholipase RssA
MNFGTGNMLGQDFLDYFPGTLETYTYLGFHEYDWPDLWRLHAQNILEKHEDGMWLTLRYRRCMNEVRRVYGNRHIAVITECGMTQGVQGGPDVGRLDAAKPVDEQRYWDSLVWYNAELLQDDYLLGACLFVVGAVPPWQTFEHLGGIVNRLEQLQAGTPPPVVSAPALPVPPVPVAVAGPSPSATGAPTGDDALAQALIAAGAAHQLLTLNPDAALQKRLVADGYLPTSGEFELEVAGVRYLAQQAEQLATGDPRVYYAPVCDTDNVQFVAAPVGRGRRPAPQSTARQGGQAMKCDVVFEGGGAKGIALIGAFQAFLDKGYTHGRLLGTSAGAITATFIAAGYNQTDMFNLLTEKENGRSVLASFLGEPTFAADEDVAKSQFATLLGEVDVPIIPASLEAAFDTQLLKTLLGNSTFRHLYSFVERGGWYTADAFVAWLTRKLDTGTINGQPRRFSAMTLAQFHAATQADLTLVASDTTGGRMLVLNHNTAPDCPIVWAVRMSMSIPLLWQEVIWQADWGKYRGKSLTGHAIVDGGLLSNFPVELFLSNLAPVTAVMGPSTGAPVVGFLIDEGLPLPPSAVPRGAAARGVKLGDLRTVERLNRLIDTATTAHDKMVIDAYAERVVRLPAYGYGTTEFDMTDARRDALIEAGRQAAEQHLRKFPPAATGRGPAKPTDSLARGMVDRIATDLLAE